ncbi:ABC transporter ATP-binding protein [Streptomyces sp. VRA16 Mangrove soil]|uniref:ABC transporter ATP-binding protein n=1 Tax=Streptomyces sp. VRA16 Mangrove soil TaxID=2817434 RepID=UPI001A9FAF0A|nr:ABC transporter ATP-binding protein [Streptomyces sp. VRA16 Mangrove soil]MBO1331246.1 ABC transporter ATP-binding protein [Streptomyces sp. VRA16 Mangrove soil]
MKATTDVILAAEHVDVVYDSGDGRPTHAVRDVCLELRRGELLGIAGESGCGKSTLAYALARLLQPPGRLAGGTVRLDGADLYALDAEALRGVRWTRLAMVFQSAMNALNPVTTVGRQFDDIFRAHRPQLSGAERRSRAGELLQLVGIDAGRLRSHPHELSGGMRQRVAIAMALALDPDVVIMDEPTTALDVVVQREILDEVEQLRERLGFAVVFITHDLNLLLEISDRLAVMYAGRVVEYADTETIASGGAVHPYTRGLLRSFPALTGERRELRGIPGQPPDLRVAEPGCAFADRCESVFEPCGVRPRLVARGPSSAACHLPGGARVAEPPSRAAGRAPEGTTGRSGA